jgi:hypothetical protein
MPITRDAGDPDELLTIPMGRAPPRPRPRTTQPEDVPDPVTGYPDLPPSLLDTTGHALAQGTSATAHGLAGIPGLLYDAAAIPQNVLANLTGADWLRAKPAREQVGSLLSTVGLPAEPDPTLINRVIEGGAEAVGGLGAGKALAAVGKPVVQMGQFAGSPSTMADTMQAARAPTRTAIGGVLAAKPGSQAVAGAAAGVGRQVAEDSAPDSRAAQIALPILAAVSAGGLLEGGASILKSIRDSRAAGDVTGMVAGLRKYMAQVSDKPGMVNAALDYQPEQQSAASLLAGAPVTPADQVAHMRNLRTTAEAIVPAGAAAGDPGAAAAEKTIRNVREGAEGLQFGLREGARRDARTNIMDGIAPAADPAAVVAPLQAEANRTGTQLRQAQTALGPAEGREVTGPVLQDQFDAARAPVRANVRQLADAVDPAGEFTVPRRPATRAIQETAADRLPGLSPDQWPSEIREIATSLSNLGRNPTYEQMRTLRARAQELANNASSSGAEAVLRDAASAMDGAIRGALPSDALARHDAYMAAARAQGTRFAGPIAGKLDAQEYGRPTLPPSTVPDQFFKSDKAGGADTMAAFGRYYGNDPAAVAAIQQHVATRVAGLTDPQTGQVNPAALAKFTAEHRGALSAVPELGLHTATQNLSNAAQLAGRAGVPGVADVPAAIGEYQRNVARTMLGTEDPHQAVAKVLSDTANRGAALRDLTQRVGTDPDARNGLRRIVLDLWGRASASDTPDITGAASLRQSGAERWWNTNQQALRGSGLFAPDELQRLQAVRDDLWSQARARARTATTGSDSQANVSNAQAIGAHIFGQPGLASDMLEHGGLPVAGYVAGGPVGGAVGAGAKVAGGFLRSIAARRQDQALGQMYHLALDPETFALMMRKQSPQTLAELAGAAERSALRRSAGAVGRFGARAIGRAADASLAAPGWAAP